MYTRTSGLQQRKDGTIKGQLTQLDPYAAQQPTWAVDRFQDDGLSAKTGTLDGRPDYHRMMALCEEGRFDIVLVTTMSRLTRTESIHERSEILGPLQRLDIKLATPGTGVLDLRTPEGEMTATFYAWVAAQENRTRVLAVRGGNQRTAEAGRKPGGRTPFGLRTGKPPNPAWSIDPGEARDVVYILERLVAGDSCPAIARVLAARGVLGPLGEPIGAQRVWNIASSRTYLGEWTFSVTQADGSVRQFPMRIPQIADEALWHAAQEALTKNQTRGLRKTRHFYLLEGLPVCVLCGSRIAIATGHEATEKYRARAATYVCSARKDVKPGCTACPLTRRKVADADGAMWQRIVEQIERPNLVESIVGMRESNAARDAKCWEKDLRIAKEGLARIKVTEAAILERFQGGMFSVEAMDVALKRTRRDRAAYEQQADAARRAGDGAQRAKTDARELKAWVERCRKAMHRAPDEDRRKLTRALIGSTPVLMDHEKVRAWLRVPTKFGSTPGGGGGKLINFASASSSLGRHVVDPDDYVELPLVA